MTIFIENIQADRLITTHQLKSIIRSSLEGGKKFPSILSWKIGQNVDVSFFSQNNTYTIIK